jgi:hypothetical protein
VLTPKAVVDKTLAKHRFFEAVNRMREAAKGGRAEEAAGDVEEAVRAARTPKAREK